MDFTSRYKALNKQQKKAVDTINGPVMVIAGPGTGKTELLSMRAANILRQTDELPENILCLTFTESGAHAMRTRLLQIIGPDAYKVAIYTFHSFGSEIINQYNQFFYQGAQLRPADELASYSILRALFDELDYKSPLASKNNGEYTHQRDTKQVISDLKKSGLTKDELLAILDANDKIMNSVEPLLQEAFSTKVSAKTATQLAPLPERIRSLKTKTHPVFTALSHLLANSLEAALSEAEATGKTPPLTAWKNRWMKKDTSGALILKSRERQKKLRETAELYWKYLIKMQEASLYDFDDMILRVVQAVETFPELRYTLQEKFHYIMVDEFQDTNAAQLRIIFALAAHETNEDQPNVMTVGDDDQAIYSFQGADVSNIHAFLRAFPSTEKIVLTDNYRSVSDILAAARNVITLGTDRLESSIEELDKTLTPHLEGDGAVRLAEHESPDMEQSWIADEISRSLAEGKNPADIAVLARHHKELEALLPHLRAKNVPVSYERRDNILDEPVVILIEQIASILDAVFRGCAEEADSFLPTLLAHPAFEFSPSDIWQLSSSAHAKRQSWIDTMKEIPVFAPFREWLLRLSQDAAITALEPIVDQIIGHPQSITNQEAFRSPIYEHFFSASRLNTDPDAYIAHLEALRTLRTLLRDHQPDQPARLGLLLNFIQKHRQLGSIIPNVRPSSAQKSAVSLMTAHKSKGLEFDTVYVIGAVDSTWGERVKARTPNISFPENLPLAPTGDSPNERMRLFFVAMTRAKRYLTLSYSTTDEAGKPLLLASFLAGGNWPVVKPQAIQTSKLHALEKAWYEPLVAQPLTADMSETLAPRLEAYKLSATHLNAFLDVSKGGPQAFLIQNLLRFPQAILPNAAFGTAIHASLQRAHSHISAYKEPKGVSDILQDFETNLHSFHLHDHDRELFTQKGKEVLGVFLEQQYESFSPSQKTELNFAGQQVVIGNARLTGALDLVDFADEALRITDYKTGKPAQSWTGKNDYEKIKLHKYRQQLAFYELLVQNSRDYRHYQTLPHRIQFVEPTTDGRIVHLEAEITKEDLERLSLLIQAVFARITSLDFPDTSHYEPTLKGILEFEEALLKESTT